MENDIFGGFTAVAQSISNKTHSIEKPEVEKLGEEEDLNEEEDSTIIANEEENDPIPFKEIEDDEEEKGEEDEEKGNSDSFESSLDIELEEAEPELAAYLQEQLFEKFGFDTEDAEEFKSIDDVVKFVGEIVEENSQPKYVDDELARIDQYVKNGGSVKQYLETVHGGPDLDSIDLTTTSNQKSIIKEHLKVKGYSESKVNRAIERYEDAGTLDEEATDAKEMLLEYQENVEQKLLEEQKIKQEGILEQQQLYVESVKKEIEAAEDVRGIHLTKKEKKDLFNYIFKPTRSGSTKYQEDYIKSQKNLIESAYFTMKGDAFVKKVQRKAASDAASKLKKKLASKGNRGRNQSGQNSGSNFDVWSAASRQLRNPINN